MNVNDKKEDWLLLLKKLRAIVKAVQVAFIFTAIVTFFLKLASTVLSFLNYKIGSIFIKCTLTVRLITRSFK
jgi:uncharacterized membrane protein